MREDAYFLPDRINDSWEFLRQNHREIIFSWRVIDRTPIILSNLHSNKAEIQSSVR